MTKVLKTCVLRQEDSHCCCINTHRMTDLDKSKLVLQRRQKEMKTYFVLTVNIMPYTTNKMQNEIYNLTVVW